MAAGSSTSINAACASTDDRTHTAASAGKYKYDFKVTASSRQLPLITGSLNLTNQFGFRLMAAANCIIRAWSFGQNFLDSQFQKTDG
eukprot:m.181440 g.181440  ORF g.181440 m.181440 type:complete len:87 (-) comp14965_c0_seq2:455-715(-)